MTEERTVERFKIRTIWFHWIHTLAFIVLIITGAILFVPELGFIAAGGWTRIVHRVTAVVFIGAPIVYFPFNARMTLHFIKETLTWGKNDLIWLVVIAAINSVISAYYYLRVVKVMWFGEPASEEKVPSSGAPRFALFLCCLGVLLLGIIPGLLMKLAELAGKLFTF